LVRASNRGYVLKNLNFDLKFKKSESKSLITKIYPIPSFLGGGFVSKYFFFLAAPLLFAEQIAK
jgi:hypothetical protein